MSEYRNSVKDLRNVEEHLKDHTTRIKQGQKELQKKDPKTAAKVPLSRVMLKNEPISSFKSPSRIQLQDYEAKESSAKPTATTYRPRFGYVL